MPLWLFAVVWVAAWAACRFVACRWWRGRYRYRVDTDGSAWVYGIARENLQMGEWVDLSSLRPFGGATRWAPFVATAVAFAAETAWLVLS